MMAYNNAIGTTMPRFRPKGTLERTALGDLWKNTLSQIPTRFGRLVYCSSLRERNTGAYRHHGLSASFGRDASEEALRNSHEETFSEWLALAIADKSADLGDYLRHLEDPSDEVVRHLLLSGQLHILAPSSSLPVERDLFLSEMELLLEVIRNGESGAHRPPGSLPHR